MRFTNIKEETLLQKKSLVTHVHKNLGKELF